MELSSLKVTVAPPAVLIIRFLFIKLKTRTPAACFILGLGLPTGMFTRDTLTLTVHRENRLSIGEEVSFRATPKPTPAAENKARIPGWQARSGRGS